MFIDVRSVFLIIWDPVRLSGVLLRELRGCWRVLETGAVRPTGEVSVTAGEPGREEGRLGSKYIFK